MINYDVLIDGESFVFNPKRTLIKLACCDCGLVHEIDLQPLMTGELKMTTKRLGRETAALRRRREGTLFKPGGTWRLVHK